MAKLTIIIPSYNHGEFLIDRLQTIYNQIYKGWEAIIIDDKSTDNSVAIIEKFLKNNSDFNVKYFIVNENNSGSGYNSWKKGIELAETKYIWIAETDDYSNPTFLEEMVMILEENHSVVLSFCNSNYVDGNKDFLYDSSKRTALLKVQKDKYEIFESQILLNLFPLNTLITNGSSVVFRKPVDEIPKEIFEQNQISDLFLWTYLLKNNRFGFLNKNLNFFRRHADSTTTKNQLVNQERLFDELIFYSNYFRLSKEKLKVIICHFAQNSSFSINTLKKMEGLNRLEIIYYYVKSSCEIFIKKMIKSICRLFQ